MFDLILTIIDELINNDMEPISTDYHYKWQPNPQQNSILTWDIILNRLIISKEKYSNSYSYSNSKSKSNFKIYNVPVNLNSTKIIDIIWNIFINDNANKIKSAKKKNSIFKN